MDNFLVQLFGVGTLRSQIKRYTRFRKFSILSAVIWAYTFIDFQENFQPPCFFTKTNDIFSTQPVVIRAYPLIRFEEKFQPTLLLEPPVILETEKSNKNMYVLHMTFSSFFIHGD